MAASMNIFVPNCLLVFLSLINGQDCLDKLGQHKPPSGSPSILGGRFPPPSVFYYHFVEPGKPLLMLNVLDETGYPAYLKWNDDYLRENFGEEMMKVEKNKTEDRNSAPEAMKMSAFLDVYKEENIFMVQTIPKVMQEDVLVPFTLSCGGFQHALEETVIWFSDGGTNSVLHYDSADNINCLLDGTKKLVLIDKKYADLVEKDGFVKKGSYSKVDVDAVDPDKFPGVMEAPWLEVNMGKGDCVYIPYRMYHQIYSPPSRNLAVNFWFAHPWWFNDSDCLNVDRSDPMKSFSEYTPTSFNQAAWSYFLEPFAGLGKITWDVFLGESVCDTEGDTRKLWEGINKDRSDSLTWEELYRVNVDETLSQFPGCFHDDEEMGDTTGDDGEITDVVSEDSIDVDETAVEVEDTGSLLSNEDIKEDEEGVKGETGKINKDMDKDKADVRPSGTVDEVSKDSKKVTHDEF